MDKKNLKDITIIITLYQTPLSQLSKLIQYKNFKIIFLDQCGTKNFKNNIKKVIGTNFDYFSTKTNIGLSKAANFLLSKVKTRFCLFTQADIMIDSYSVYLLKLALLKNTNYIFAGPKFIKRIDKKINKNISFYFPRIIKAKSINAACFLLDVKKVRKIGFFDQDFFLYWEDIFLMKEINKSKYKIAYVDQAKAVHEIGKSTKSNYKIFLIRNMNFKFGEYLFDYKMSQFRPIKILRNILRFPFYFIFFLLTLQFLKSYIKLSEFFGAIKFIYFYLSNRKIKKLHV
jgi:GT2 family glycosyltransferase